MRNSSMGDVEAVPRSSLMLVAPLTWSKEVPDVDLPDLGGRYQNLGGAHAQVLSSCCVGIERETPPAGDAVGGGAGWGGGGGGGGGPRLRARGRGGGGGGGRSRQPRAGRRGYRC